MSDGKRPRDDDPSESGCGRGCRRGRHAVSHFLHTKLMLVIVVILNILDCLLVLGELNFDFNHSTTLIKNYQHESSVFIESLAEKYPHDIHDPSHLTIGATYEQILHGHILWGGISDTGSLCSGNSSSSSDSHEDPSRHRRSSGGGDEGGEEHHGHTIEETLGHSFHLASVTILGLLTCIIVVKVLSTGVKFFKGRMEVFDAAVIIISFTIDLVFINGVMTMDISQYVIVLTFLLPWRIIRIVNSLLVAVLDEQRLNQKIMYKQKKKSDKQLQEALEKMKILLKQLEGLKGLCAERGISPLEVSQVVDSINFYTKGKLKGMRAFETYDPNQTIVTFNYLQNSDAANHDHPPPHDGETSQL